MENQNILEREEYSYRASINASKKHWAAIKQGAPIVALAGFVAYPYVGVWGVAGLGGLFAIRLFTTSRSVRRDWQKIDNGDRATLWENTKEEDREGLKKAFKQSPVTTSPSPVTPPLLPPSTNTQQPITKLNITQLLESATGIALMGNSGSGKTTLAKAIASEAGEVQIIVFDPEDTDWGELFVLRDYAAILEQMQIILDLLEQRDRTKLVIIADEWPAIRLWASKQGKDQLNLVDSFLLQVGSRGRKYEKLGIFCGQSSNVKAWGLEGLGDFFENFALVRLQKLAIKYARNLSDRSIYEALQNIAYSCLIGDDELCLHPLLGHHKEVRKGAKPEGLKELRSLPLTVPLTSATSEAGTPQILVTPAPPPNATSATSGEAIPVEREKIQELIANGWSLNRIAIEHYQTSKNSKKYQEIADIVREIKSENCQDISPYGFTGLV